MASTGQGGSSVAQTKLPQSPDKYDRRDQDHTRRLIELAFKQLGEVTQQVAGGEPTNIFGRYLLIDAGRLAPRDTQTMELGTSDHYWLDLYTLILYAATVYAGGAAFGLNGAYVLQDASDVQQGGLGVGGYTGLGMDIFGSNGQLNCTSGFSTAAVQFTSGAATLNLAFINCATLNYLGVEVTSDSTITFGDPINPPPTQQSQELTYELKNSSGGPLTTPPAFGPAYVNLLGPMTPSDGKTIQMKFTWSYMNSVWVNTFLSTEY